MMNEKDGLDMPEQRIPADIAAQDQADAEASRVHRNMGQVLQFIAGKEGDGKVHEIPDAPGVVAINEKFRAWVNENPGIKSCPHYPLLTMPIAFWSPAVPVVSCVTCTTKSYRAMFGKPEDSTCDLCGTLIGPKEEMIYGSITKTGSVVHGVNYAPLVITFGVCPGCMGNYAGIEPAE